MTLVDNGATTEPSTRELVAIAQVAQRLRARFTTVPEAQIEQKVHAEYHRFDGSPIRDFVPIFVERNARAELLALPFA
jgi:hypothetical protein